MKKIRALLTINSFALIALLIIEFVNHSELLRQSETVPIVFAVHSIAEGTAIGARAPLHLSELSTAMKSTTVIKDNQRTSSLWI